MNKGEIIILASFCNKVIVVVSNLFAVANKYRRFLIGSLESLLIFPLSQLDLCSRILKTIFCKNELKNIFGEILAGYRANKT